MFLIITFSIIPIFVYLIPIIFTGIDKNVVNFVFLPICILWHLGIFIFIQNCFFYNNKSIKEKFDG